MGINKSQLYGPTSPRNRKTTPSPAQVASRPPVTAENAPAFAWAGFIALLVVVRLVYETGKTN